MVSVSGRGATCVQKRRRGERRGIQSLPFNQCPSPLRAALMEMPGGTKIEIGLQEPGGGNVRSSGSFGCEERRREGGSCFSRYGEQFGRGEELKTDRFSWWLWSRRATAAAAAAAISHLHAPTAGPQSASAEPREEEAGGRAQQTPARESLPNGN